jgi:hypothetical protein
MFALSSFKNKLNNLTRPNNFYIEIDPPTYIRNAIVSRSRSILSGSASISGKTWLDRIASNFSPSKGINDSFRFRCESSELPGKTIATSEDVSFGSTTKHAYDTTYSDINLTVMAGEDMIERAFFEIWMENIVNNTNLAGGGMGSKAGLIKYYNEYADGQVRMYHTDNSGNVVARYTLYEAYPIQLSTMNLNWEEQNTYQRFSATISYRYHVVEFAPAVAPAVTVSVTDALKAATTGQGSASDVLAALKARSGRV